MKQLLKHTLFGVLLLALAGCDSLSSSSSKKEALGLPYEVIIVCNNTEWKGPLGEELRSVLQAPVEMLNQEEPMFDVLHALPQSFDRLYSAHRNIIKVVCSPNVQKTAILAKYDVDAAPQIVLTFQGPTIESMINYLKENGDALCRVLEMAERDRTLAAAKRGGAKDLESTIRKQFGVDIPLNTGYKFRTQSDNFIWASNEFPVASQGFFIYSHPFSGKKSITTEALVKARNEFAMRIPGPSNGSYMTTLSRIPNIENNGYVNFVPERRVLTINGHDWIELRGFWEVEGDFMGGPFVSYTTLNKQTGQLLTIDCYVFSPNEEKRNYLRTLEHLVYGVTFPTEE